MQRCCDLRKFLAELGLGLQASGLLHLGLAQRRHSWSQIQQVFLGPFPNSTKDLLVSPDSSNNHTVLSAQAPTQLSQSRSKTPTLQPLELRFSGPPDSTHRITLHYPVKPVGTNPISRHVVLGVSPSLLL